MQSEGYISLTAIIKHIYNENSTFPICICHPKFVPYSDTKKIKELSDKDMSKADQHQEMTAFYWQKRTANFWVCTSAWIWIYYKDIYKYWYWKAKL